MIEYNEKPKKRRTISFTTNNIKLITAYRQHIQSGYKFSKADLYRKIYNKKGNPQGCNKMCNTVLKKFNSLSIETQNKYLEEWGQKVEAEDIEVKMEQLQTMHLINTAVAENNKKFYVGLEEGKEAGKSLMKRLHSVVNFSTEKGQCNFLEHVATLMLEDYHTLSKLSYYDDEKKRYVSNAPVLNSLIKGLTDVASLNQQGYQKSPEYLNKMLALKKTAEQE